MEDERQPQISSKREKHHCNGRALGVDSRCSCWDPVLPKLTCMLGKESQTHAMDTACGRGQGVV